MCTVSDTMEHAIGVILSWKPNFTKDSIVSVQHKGRKNN